MLNNKRKNFFTKMGSRCERIIGKGAKKGQRCELSQIKGGFCEKCLKLKEVTETLEFGCRSVFEENINKRIRCGNPIDELGLCADCLHNRGYISSAYKSYMLYKGDDTKCRGVKLSGGDAGIHCYNICDPNTKLCGSCSKKKTYEGLIRDNFYKQSTTPSDRLYNISVALGISKFSSCEQDADNISSKT